MMLVPIIRDVVGTANLPKLKSEKQESMRRCLEKGFCRNKGLKLNRSGGQAGDLESQAIELLGSGRDFAFVAIELPLFDHVHGLDAGDEFGCPVEALKSEHGSRSVFDGPMVLLHEVVQISCRW